MISKGLHADWERLGMNLACVPEKRPLPKSLKICKMTGKDCIPVELDCP